MSLNELVALSRKYGKDPNWVIGGGGNTSFKDGEHLYIKGSGVSLGEIDADGFVKMRLDRLNQIWSKDYSEDPDQREAEVLQDLMEAREKGEENKRPSVETLMHALFPPAFVVHTHPSLVNGLTCSMQGEKAANELFPEAMWVKIVNPGYVLAHEMKKRLEEYRQRLRKDPRIVLMQNHGLVCLGADDEEIEALQSEVMESFEKAIERKADMQAVERPQKEIDAYSRTIRENSDAEEVIFTANREMERFFADQEAFKPLSIPYSPDHMIHSGIEPLFVASEADRESREKNISEALASYRQKHNAEPKIIAVQGFGLFSCEKKRKMALLARDFFLDEIKIAAASESFGGIHPLPQAQIDFISSWEVERYRRSVSEKD